MCVKYTTCVCWKCLQVKQFIVISIHLHFGSKSIIKLLIFNMFNRSWVWVCVWVRVVMQCLYIVYGWWLNRWSAVSMLFQLSCWKNTKTKSKQYDNIVYEAENGYALTGRSHLEWIKASNECFWVRVSARACVFVCASFFHLLSSSAVCFKFRVFLLPLDLSRMLCFRYNYETDLCTAQYIENKT